MILYIFSDAIKTKYPNRPLNAYLEAKTSFNNLGNEWNNDLRNIPGLTKEIIAKREHMLVRSPTTSEPRQLFSATSLLNRTVVANIDTNNDVRHVRDEEPIASHVSEETDHCVDGLVDPKKQKRCNSKKNTGRR